MNKVRGGGYLVVISTFSIQLFEVQSLLFYHVGYLIIRKDELSEQMWTELPKIGMNCLTRLSES